MRRDEYRFNRFGLDRDGYNADGFNEAGYNRDGYDRSGYQRPLKFETLHGLPVTPTRAQRTKLEEFGRKRGWTPDCVPLVVFPESVITLTIGVDSITVTDKGKVI